MELRTLAYFLAVAEEGSITKAAQRLHMSQPPLTVRLKGLEDELGVALFTRHGRGVELTTAGRVLVERARRVLVDVAGATEAVRAVGHGVTGRLTLASARTVAPVLLSDLLRGLHAEAPDVTVEVRDVTEEVVLDRVSHVEADAGLVVLGPRDTAAGETSAQYANGDRGLETAVIAREPLVVVLPDGHPHATRERANLAALAEEVLIAPARGAVPSTHEHVIAAWRAVNGSADRIRESDSTTTTLALVAAGHGIAVLPQSLAKVAWQGLATVPLRQHRPAVETAIVWRHDATSPVLRRFLRLALATPEPDVLGADRARARPEIAGL
jgi:DNA-binding transcriptional LysR family regulator